MGGGFGVNLKTLVIVTIMATIGFLLAGLAQKTLLGQVPLLGDGLGVVAGRGQL
jgi:hypothetical protein